jgi:hypothetical protein
MTFRKKLKGKEPLPISQKLGHTASHAQGSDNEPAHNRERVTASISELKGMTHTQLKATANEMEHKTAFTRFKKALTANGINYDRLIALASADKTARLEANATASLTGQAWQSGLARPFLRKRPRLQLGAIIGRNRRSQEGGMARLQSQRDSRPLCDQARPQGRRGMAVLLQRSQARQGRRRTCSRSRGPRHQIRHRPHRRTYRWRQKSGR